MCGLKTWFTSVKASGPPAAEAWGLGRQDEEKDSDGHCHGGISYIPGGKNG
jgi:hypothetical protein